MILKEVHYDRNGQVARSPHRDGHRAHIRPGLIVYKDGKRLWDAVCTRFSYGGWVGLLEVMGKALIGNDEDVEGWLAAEDVVEMVKESAPCT